MGTNPGSASYSRRQARRVGAGGGAGGAGGGVTGGASPFSPTAVSSVNLLAAQMMTSSRQGLRLRELTPQEARQAVSGFTDRELNTRLMNTEARIRDVSGILDDVNSLSRAPLPPQLNDRLIATRRQGQLSIIGLNRYANAISAEIASRG
jgi:hypothetical protein